MGTLPACIAVSLMLLAPQLASTADDLTPDNRHPSVEAKFLITITEPGTYRLTQNLLVGDANTTAIEIDANDVTIEMNGYSIQGPSTCTPPPVSCAPMGTGNGIHAIGRNNILVKNGSIHGMGNVGIYLESNSSRIESMKLSGNGGGAIVVFGGVVSNNIIENNGGDGVAGVDIVLQGSRIRDNQQSGFKAFGQSAYAGTTFSGNNNNAAQVDPHPVQRGGNLCNATVCP